MPVAPSGTERHRDQGLDQIADHETTAERPCSSGTAEALLAAVAEGAEASFELAAALTREILDDPMIRQARALEELLRARSPFALVRAVELAEARASGAATRRARIEREARRR